MIKQYINSLHKELKTRINASIHVGKSKVADTITISITKNNTTFCLYVDDIQSKILRGLTSRALATDICEKYKQYLLSQYFYN